MPRLPDRMVQRAWDLARGEGGWTPPPARDAATVCLLRDTDAGLEVFLMRRRTTMAFAAGMHVYPGGAVEASDAEVPVLGGDHDAVARRLSTPAPAALLAAAARETFEECGALIVAPPSHEDLEAERHDLDEGRLAFRDLLEGRGLAVDGAAFVPLAHWVTPEVEDRRYDTRFFVVALPEGQQARRSGGEADVADWWRPADALVAHAEGRMAMLPPTVATLAALAHHTVAADALAAAAGIAVRPLMPRAVIDGDELTWCLVDERTGEVLEAAPGPHASETDGARP
jgi:8-oxo-dGTP pyrophosphatase MutT (NUDIX family)